MNKLSVYTLKVLRRLYTNIFPATPLSIPERIEDADIASGLIYDHLVSDKPCMIGRFGATELSVMVNYIGIKNDNHSIWKYIKGNSLDWWWNEGIVKQMHESAGFFPPTPDNLVRFNNLMLTDMKEVDVLGSWLENERYFENELQNCSKIHLELLNPYFSKIPWTKALEHKKVLIISMFSESIGSQYQKRELLFRNKDVLPAFDLITYKAVQTFGEKKTTAFRSWFEALDHMKEDTDKIDFDICILGCGAYGFPLAAHIKRRGKKVVHLGGSIQLLFGIKGKRWENPDYDKDYSYIWLMNEHWIRPNKSEKPQNAGKVENACYW